MGGGRGGGGGDHSLSWSCSHHLTVTKNSLIHAGTQDGLALPVCGRSQWSAWLLWSHQGSYGWVACLHCALCLPCVCLCMCTVYFTVKLLITNHQSKDPVGESVHGRYSPSQMHYYEMYFFPMMCFSSNRIVISSRHQLMRCLLHCIWLC